MKFEYDNLDDLTKIGIYSITNNKNGKKYIGSTAKSFKSRWKKHITNLKNGGHTSHHLQNAWNKYGEDNFIFKIEEIVDSVENLLDLERNYINKYNSFNNGYNENPDPNLSPMLNEQTQEKVSEGMKKYWERLREDLSPEEYKALCKEKHGHEPWNKGKKMTEEQTAKMHTKKKAVTQAMKDVHIANAQRFKDKADYILVYDLNGNWLNTFWCTSDLVKYSLSEYNDLPIKTRAGTSKKLDQSKVCNAIAANKPYKGLFFKRVPKDRKLPCANGMNSWKAEKPIMSQAENTLSEGAETTGEVQPS